MIHIRSYSLQSLEFSLRCRLRRKLHHQGNRQVVGTIVRPKKLFSIMQMQNCFRLKWLGVNDSLEPIRTDGLLSLLKALEIDLGLIKVLEHCPTASGAWKRFWVAACLPACRPENLKIVRVFQC